MTYLVLENHLSYSIVLDKAGDFIKVANMGYDVGETLTEIRTLKRGMSRPFQIALGTVAASVIIAFVVILSTMMTAFGQVTLRINPSVIIDVDRQNTVTRIQAGNRDGETLLQGYEYKDKSLMPVIDELVTRAIDDDFLLPGGKIALDLNARDEAWLDVTSSEISAHLQSFMADIMDVTIEITRLDVGTQQVIIPVRGLPARPDPAAETDREEDMTDYGIEVITDSPLTRPTVRETSPQTPAATRPPVTNPPVTSPPASIRPAGTNPAGTNPPATNPPQDISDYDDSSFEDSRDDSAYDASDYDDSLYGDSPYDD